MCVQVKQVGLDERGKVATSVVIASTAVDAAALSPAPGEAMRKTRKTFVVPRRVRPHGADEIHVLSDVTCRWVGARSVGAGAWPEGVLRPAERERAAGGAEGDLSDMSSLYESSGSEGCCPAPLLPR